MALDWLRMGDKPVITWTNDDLVLWHHEGIRQYDSCDTGHSDNVNIAAEHQEPAEVLSQLDNTSNSPVYGEYKCC